VSYTAIPAIYLSIESEGDQKNQTMGLTSVLLADRQRMLLDCLVHLLRQDFEIVGTVCDGRRLIEVAKQEHPDVIVMELTMPVISGMEAIRILQGEERPPKIVIL
jgi:two-component system chemotaxis response regulator CheY